MKKTWSRVLATVLVLAMVLCMPGFAASADTVDYDADHATLSLIHISEPTRRS